MNATNLAHHLAWFANLNLETLEQIDAVYAPNAQFKDPFKEIEGITNIKYIYQQMLHQLEQPRFIITHSLQQNHQAFVRWDFIFRRKQAEISINGSSYFALDQQGLISQHLDYWDATQVYQHIPVLGAVLGLVKCKIAASYRRRG